MKVAHIVEAFGSGLITFIKNLTDGIECEHTIFYAQREVDINEVKKEFKYNVRFVSWKSAKREINIFNDVIASIELYRFLKTDSYDVIHLHSSKAGAIGRVVGLFFPDKIILYTPNGASFARKDITRLKITLYKTIEYCSSLLCGQVICVSKSETQLFHSIGVQAITINNGIRIKSYEKKIRLRERFSIVTIGRISTQKNPHLFNDIAKNLLHYPIDFIWVGDGELRSTLSSPNIKITGWISSAEVEKYLSNSDLYISTSIWEGLPFAVLEAMNYRLPLLLNECVGNIDLVSNSINGYCFKTKNEALSHIINYLNDTSVLAFHGDNSYNKLLREFDTLSMCRNYSEIYRVLAKNLTMPTN
ncbi:glycosyl transferase family 1 [Runella rosea]|uniref:Glycosyl transferase family 1 n=1 Tax=Runella rosea TaxID=2259595 RepID=A0A344TCP6_9BACT|nr:glycosyltransferase [Runella rosea]AXE16417.1 glycosyl transferase family 1 [Runella rosea]